MELDSLNLADVRLFEEIPPSLLEFWDSERPWSLLGQALEALLRRLPSSRFASKISPDVHLIGDRIVIESGVRLAPGVVLEGPLYLGEGTVVRPGAYVRGGCWIGARCVVGANTEIKHSIFLEGANAPHLNYVGDSILGRGCNLGAGTVLSNFRHDGTEISIPQETGPLPTGRRKLGAILGDDVQTGCNSVLHPGTIVGAATQIYPGVQLRSGVYPADSVIKLIQEQRIVEKRRL